MSRFVFLAAFAAAVGWATAAPVPPAAKDLVAGLSDPSATARDNAAAALRGRADALPWLRRASRSADVDTARRAGGLLIAPGATRQAAAARAIDACIKSGQADLFMEWHHYWQPEKKDDLWPIGLRMIQVVREDWAKWCPPEREKGFERIKMILEFELPPLWKPGVYDGPASGLPNRKLSNTSWSIRTDQWPQKVPAYDGYPVVSVAGRVTMQLDGRGRFFALGPFQATGPKMRDTFAVCDGECYNGGHLLEYQSWRDTFTSFVVCRGNFRGGTGVSASVLLVDGDIELFRDSRNDLIKDSVIRASGEIRIPKGVQVVNSTIEPHAKNATAPYKFFELSDVGLALADDEEGLVVAGVKADTPFGASGIARGDIVRAIDDAPAGGSEQFRRLIRRALVRQGDCLVTVARGDKTLDLPVYFPLPK
jgi:hypothetical protein